MSRRCADCLWSEPAVMEDGPVLECRVYPPQNVTVDGEIVRLFPQVDADDWCGQFVPRRPRRREDA